MKNFLIIAMTASLVACGKPQWETVEPKESNVKIEFPGPPKYKAQTVKVPAIGAMRLDSYKYTRDNTVFLLQIGETLDMDISEDSLFDSTHAIRRRLTTSGGEVLTEFETDTFGYESYVISARQGNGAITHQKVIKIENIQYTLAIFYKDGHDDSEEVDKFFSSFSLL